MFVVDAIGDNTVDAYSSIALATALHVESNIFLCLFILGACSVSFV